MTDDEWDFYLPMWLVCHDWTMIARIRRGL